MGAQNRQTGYAELHAHSNFSFLDGASHPEELVERAAHLGLTGLALTDHDGLYGVPKFAQAAAEHGLPTVFGAELRVSAPDTQPPERTGMPDPAGDHLLVLARDPAGYHALSAAISRAYQRGGAKGRPQYDLTELAGVGAGNWLILTGCRKGAVRRALAGEGGPETTGTAAADRQLSELVALFGSDNVVVELTAHGDPLDDERNDALAQLAGNHRLEMVATNNVHYATAGQYQLATVMAAIRAGRSLDDLDGWLPAVPTAYLRSARQMHHRFARYPGAVGNTVEIAAQCAFELRLVAPPLPAAEVPTGHTPMSWLRRLTSDAAPRYYGPDPGPTGTERVPGAHAQLRHELAVIEQLDLAGYFLIVYDLVRFCRRNTIMCQGRGSAANSAVCFVLGITKVDAVRYGLLFERFLAPERDGYPDIDLDIASDRREEVIQYVYTRYGRDRAAQVANVISYRPRSAVRDVAKAFGYGAGQQDAWSKQLDWGERATAATEHTIPAPVARFADALLRTPRHLGLHPGGMVLCGRPVIEVCPVEPARMPGRTALQWDKDDCAYAGLVKFDLLGLGMLSALATGIELIDRHYGVAVDLALLDKDDPAVYRMLCAADSIGVFQVESRAQISTLPRLQPENFYDLAVQVALIRPGPIQGGSVHPYLRRRKQLRDGGPRPTAPHPLLEKTLHKTLGVPLFQEQLMQMATDIAGFTPSEADRLRRAMGSKRSEAEMAKLRDRLYQGMATNGITGKLADDMYTKLLGFASFGFPESHAISFALIVYSSAWMKRYYPSAFYAALLSAQPMGFYSPQSLIADARRHGVYAYPPDINASSVAPTLRQRPRGAAIDDDVLPGWPKQQLAVQLGLNAITGVGEQCAQRIVAQRDAAGPFRDIADLCARVELRSAHIESLARADVFAGLGLPRRRALWDAGTAAQLGPDRLAGAVATPAAPMLPAMSEVEAVAADIAATGISTQTHPMRFLRAALTQRDVIPIARLRSRPAGDRLHVAGIITHRQRPGTARGVTFLNLEDETGMLNVICSVGLWARYRTMARVAAAMVIRGRVEYADGALNFLADKLTPLDVAAAVPSRDFR